MLVASLLPPPPPPAQVSDEMITEATFALAGCVSENMLRQGIIYPRLADIRDISVQVAARVMEKAKERNLSRLSPWPTDLVSYVEGCMWEPQYYDFNT